MCKEMRQHRPGLLVQVALQPDVEEDGVRALKASVEATTLGQVTPETRGSVHLEESEEEVSDAMVSSCGCMVYATSRLAMLACVSEYTRALQFSLPLLNMQPCQMGTLLLVTQLLHGSGGVSC